MGRGALTALQGDTAKAKAAYQDFLTLWKHAEPDIPILIAAKIEYAKLKSLSDSLQRGARIDIGFVV